MQSLLIVLLLALPGVGGAPPAEPSLCDPSNIVEYNGIAYFSASDHVAGRELWRSDGTPAGTYRVKDIAPGPADGIERWPFLSVSGGVLYFAADDGRHGRELWRSDGTGEGTFLVRDIRRKGGSSPGFLVTAGGVLYFIADDGEHGRELWRSDGTRRGTVLVKDLRPGRSGAFFPPMPKAVAVGPVLYFAADDGVHGSELFRSDGTEAGTVLVRDLRPGPVGSVPPVRPAPVWAGGLLYFAADDGEHGLKLWVTDGTGSGTRLVRDIGPWPVSSGLSEIARFGEGVVFSAANPGGGAGLWRSDGTEEGTALLAGVYARDLTSAGGLIYFVGGEGKELWRTDGTPEGTVPLGAVRVEELTAVGDRVFFRGLDAIGGGGELWRSDGTVAGTVLVRDIRPSCGSEPSDLADVAGVAFFSADDGALVRTLWRSDGTEAGTIRLSTPCKPAEMPGPGP